MTKTQKHVLFLWSVWVYKSLAIWARLYQQRLQDKNSTSKSCDESLIHNLVVYHHKIRRIWRVYHLHPFIQLLLHHQYFLILEIRSEKSDVSDSSGKDASAAIVIMRLQHTTSDAHITKSQIFITWTLLHTVRDNFLDSKILQLSQLLKKLWFNLVFYSLIFQPPN